MVEDEASALADAKAARTAGADLVEFRIDSFFSGSLNAHGELDQREVSAILRLVARSPLPCIVTCRSAEECGGTGGYDGDEMARVSLYERLGTAALKEGKEHPPRYLDIEHAAYTRSANIKQKINLAVDHPAQARDVRTSLILSMHDFKGRPSDLLRRVAAMQAEPVLADGGGGVVKIAVTPRSIRDNLELFDLMRESHTPMIALGMGRFGVMSRILAPKFGGLLTFAALQRGKGTAPGQPTVRELLDTYRFRAIGRGTRVLGIIGWPVEHSLSPAVHNAGFEAVGFDGVYLTMPVPPEYEHFKASLAALIDHPRLDFAGCSVTVPHKQHLVRFARERQVARLSEPGAGARISGEQWELDEISTISGAANTLAIDRGADGRAVRFRVLNTDAPAAADCLEAQLGDLTGKHAALLGAGGVSRAIALGLAARGCRVTVYNRTRDNADALAAELARNAASVLPGITSLIAAAEPGTLSRFTGDAIINGTPIGMAGGPPSAPDALPLGVDLAALAKANPGLVVMDTVYAPLRTPLLAEAERLGLATIDGLSMFVRQASGQFAAWTSCAENAPAVPMSLFERVARETAASRGANR